MAEFNGNIMLTAGQLAAMNKGRLVKVWREGKPIYLGLKNKHNKALKIHMKIKILKAKIKALRVKI